MNVHRTTSKGGVLRSEQYSDGLQVQCTAGPIHFDAWVDPTKKSISFCITSAADAARPDAPAGVIRFQTSPEFSAMLGEFFGTVTRSMEHALKQLPEQQAKSAQVALAQKAAELEATKAELKAVRNHKRKPRPKAVGE